MPGNAAVDVDPAGKVRIVYIDLDNGTVKLASSP